MRLRERIPAAIPLLLIELSLAAVVIWSAAR
jgi:hypothetical protein